MIYATTTEGVAALRQSANNIKGATQEILEAMDKVKSTAENKQGGLGPHEGALMDALDGIKESLKGVEDTAEEIATWLEDVADGYEDEMNSPPPSFGGGK